MVDIPKDELSAMPYDIRENHLALEPGKLVIELGNKKNKTGLYREFYEAHGMRYVCLDWNGEDGAIPFDMGKELPPRVLDILSSNDIAMVTNFGFMEHVYTDQVQGWYNVAQLCPVGAYLAMSMPRPGYWEHHGVYQPHLEWYSDWLTQNGFDVDHLSVYERNERRHMIVTAAYRSDASQPYFHPSDDMVHITPVSQRRNPQERNCGIKP